MALEPLAGPFAVTDGLSGEGMTQIYGLGPWLDGYGLLVRGAFPTAFGGGMVWGVMTFDGAFAPLVHYNDLAYGLALVGSAADPSARTHWACVQQTYGGLNGEWDVDPFTFYAGTPSGFTDEAMASFYPFVRLHDRYLVAYSGQVRAKTAANHSGVVEATLPFSAYRMAYDRRFRRLLIVPPPTGTPAALNTTATGYPVRNVATHVLPPIPLQAPRAGRPFPVLIKAIGDRGEGVVGVVSLAGDLVGPNVAGLNGQGEAVVLMTGASAGAHSLSVALEVPCLR